VFEERLGKDDPQTKESENFCSSLAASAVRVAKLEKEASARAARQGGFGLSNARRVGSGAAAATSGIAGASPATAGAANTNNKSLDEIVKFIQGGSGASPAKTKGKSKAGRK